MPEIRPCAQRRRPRIDDTRSEDARRWSSRHAWRAPQAGIHRGERRAREEGPAESDQTHQQRCQVRRARCRRHQCSPVSSK